MRTFELNDAGVALLERPAATSASRAAEQVTPADAGHLLIASAGTGSSAGAMRLARLLAERSAASVEVITVFEPVVPLPRNGLPLQKRKCEGRDRPDAAVQLRSVRAQRSNHCDGSDWNVRMDVGDPPSVIASAARDADSRLVLLGLGRPDPADRELGSLTALRLGFFSHVPVLAVAPWVERLPARAIVAADDGEALLHTLGSTLPVLREGATVTLVLCGATPNGRFRHRALVRRMRGRLEELLRSSEGSVARGVTVRWAEIPAADPDAVLALASAEAADLIAVPLSGRSTAERSLMGELPARMLLGACCSVLIDPWQSEVQHMTAGD